MQGRRVGPLIEKHFGYLNGRDHVLIKVNNNVRGINPGAKPQVHDYSKKPHPPPWHPIERSTVKIVFKIGRRWKPQDKESQDAWAHRRSARGLRRKIKGGSQGGWNMAGKGQQKANRTLVTTWSRPEHVGKWRLPESELKRLNTGKRNSSIAFNT